MQEGEAVGVLVGLEGGFVHQAANGEMCHQQPEHFLADQIGGLAAQHDFSAAQMGFEFVERGFLFLSACDRAPPIRRPEPARDQEWW